MIVVGLVLQMFLKVTQTSIIEPISMPGLSTQSNLLFFSIYIFFIGGDTIYKNDYFYGFIGKHILKIVNKKYDGCRECLNFISSENHDFSELLELRDKYKVLIKPSLDLCSLLDSLEKEIMEHTKRHINSNVGPGPDFVEKLIDHFHDETNLTLKLIGCNKHKFDLTSNTMDYYIAVRLNFIFTEYNKIANLKAETKNLKKGAKLK